MPRRLSTTSACPCGLGAPYGGCCGPLHAGRAAAPTAERLMRSRYSAFAVRDEGYLLRTWAAAARPLAVDFDPAVRWTGLDVLGSTGGTAFHTEGTVDFRARYRVRGHDGEQRENSRFVREDGVWVYAGEAGVTERGLDPEVRAAVARRVLDVLADACPGGRAALRGSLAAGTADAYSDIDVAWAVPADRFGACVDRASQILARVRPLLSLRGDPDTADADGRRLLFAAFEGLPLFWRLDLDVSAAPGGAVAAPTVRHPWPPAASALANAVAAVKMLHRGDEDAAHGLLSRARPRVGLPPGLLGDWAGDLAALASAATTLDPGQARLARLLPPVP